jgi:hypothetical protein
VPGKVDQLRHPVTPGTARHPRHVLAAHGHAICAPWLHGVPEGAERKSPRFAPYAAGGRRKPGVPRLPVPRPAPRGRSPARRPRPRGLASTRPAVLRGRPAKQQPGQPPYRGGGTRAGAARRPGSLRLQQQAVPLPGPLRVVLNSLRKALVDTHGLLQRRRGDSWRAEPPRVVVSVQPRPRQLAQAACGALTCTGLFRRLPRHASPWRGP